MSTRTAEGPKRRRSRSLCGGASCVVCALVVAACGEKPPDSTPAEPVSYGWSLPAIDTGADGVDGVIYLALQRSCDEGDAVLGARWQQSASPRNVLLFAAGVQACRGATGPGPHLLPAGQGRLRLERPRTRPECGAVRRLQVGGERGRERPARPLPLSGRRESRFPAVCRGHARRSPHTRGRERAGRRDDPDHPDHPEGRCAGEPEQAHEPGRADQVEHGRQACESRCRHRWRPAAGARAPQEHRLRWHRRSRRRLE